MDGDTAGRTASLAAGEHLRLAELDVRVAILPNGSDPAAYLAPPENGLDVFRADHGLPLITARLEHAIAQQGDTIQWIEGRLNALRRVARYVATYPPDLAARQVTGIASALKLDVSTVTAEIVGSFDRGRTVARPALRTGVIDL
jgi:DNA primase